MPPRKRKAPSAEPKIEDEFQALSCEDIRKELQSLGENPGPIDASNKAIYIRLLARKKQKTVDTDEQPRDDVDIDLHRSSFQRPPLRHSVVPEVKRASMPSKLKPMLAVPSTPPSSAKTVLYFEARGLTAAAFTPFTESGEINLLVIRQYADYLCQRGVLNVFVSGTTGEGLTLTVSERKLLAEEWVKVAAGRITVIVQVGCESLKDTCTLAEHAQEIGANAIGVLPSSYHKPPSIVHLVTCLEKVCEAASSIPLYYYHIPARTGVTFLMEDFLDVAMDRLPTLRGLKYSSPVLSDYGRCVVHSGGRYQILYGCDEQLIGALALGCTGAIGSTYNFAGKLYNRLLVAFQKGDLETAKLEQRRSQAMVKVHNKYGEPSSVGKAIMKLVGLDVGPPRLPALPLSMENVKSLEKDLRDIGFFDWA